MVTYTLRSSWAAVAALSLLFVASCTSHESADKNNQLAFNDYESLVGWVPNVESVTREQAHSGKYSVKVGPANEFGLGYGMELEKIIDHKPRKLRIEGWGYMSDANAGARLGFQLFDPTQNKEVFGDGIDFNTAVKVPGKWVKISKDIVLPATVTGAQQMRVFLWRGMASSTAYIDDLRISEVVE